MYVREGAFILIKDEGNIWYFLVSRNGNVHSPKDAST